MKSGTPSRVITSPLMIPSVVPSRKASMNAQPIGTP